MPDFAVSTAFTANDRISAAFKTMEKRAGRFGRSADKAFAKAGRSASQFQTITKSILTAGIVQRGIAGLTTGLGSVTRQFIDFDDAITGATARFKDIGPDAANFNQQLKILKASARDAGATTEFTAAQAASALDFLARASFNSVEAMGSLNGMINLATASGEDFATVADFSSDLLGAFGLNVSNTAQKISNLNRLNDVLVKTANSANVTIEDMFETMKVAAPIATKVGIGLEEVAALTAVIGDAGIKGSQGATTLKNAILNIAAAKKPAVEALQSIGVQVDDGTGNMRRFTDILSDMGKNLKGVGNLQQIKVLNAILGKFAIAGGANLINSIERINTFEQTLINAAGTSKKTADIMRKSLGNRFKALASAATELGFKFFEAFENKGVNVIQEITMAVRNFDMGPIIEAAKVAIAVFKGLMFVIKPFLPILPALVAGWIAYSTALKGIAIFNAISGFVQMFAVLRGGIGTMAAFNAILMANPLGLVVVSATAIVALLVVMEKKFGILTKLFNKFAVLRGVRNLGVKAFEAVLGKPDVPDITKPTPPNQAQLEANQNINFQGRLQIAGAPAGSSVDSKTTGAPPVDLELLGES